MWPFKENKFFSTKFFMDGKTTLGIISMPMFATKLIPLSSMRKKPLTQTT